MGKQMILTFLAALASFATAQLVGLPTCATNPAIAVLEGSSCGLTNFQCICESPDIISSLQAVVENSCTDSADISSGLVAAQSLCAPYGGVATAASTTDATTGSITDAAAAAGTSTTAADAGTSSSSLTFATITSAPYAAGNLTTAASTSGLTSNKTATGSPIATGAASKAVAAGAMRDAGVLATIAALIGATLLM